MAVSVTSSLLLLACATIQEPPGGPPDFTPPVILAITPDSGSTLTDLDQPLVLRFNEVVSERPGADLNQMFVISPRPRELAVSWRRDEIAVRPREGWRPDVPYHVSVLPGMADLRNNRLTTGRTIVFSTGGPIPETEVTGRVVDWEAGAAGARALVELIRVPDSLVFWSLADSTGTFTVRAVPPGEYVLAATMDRNNNRRRDIREPFDSAVVRLDSLLSDTLWAFVHDTTGPRLRLAARVDSVAIRLDFNQPLSPEPMAAGAVSVRELPDSVPVAVTSVLTQVRFDSLRAAARVDSAPAADTAGAAPDTTRIRVTPPPGGQAAVAVATDSASLALLRQRPRLSPTRVVVLSQPMRPGGRYVITAEAANVSGATAQSTSVLVLPAAPADSASP